MKLHHTLIEELIKTFTTFGGWKGETKLREQLQKLDISIYEQKASQGNSVLVLTEALQKAILKQNG